MQSDFFNEIAPFTKLTRERLDYLACALAQLNADNVQGDIVQCGIWRGGSVMVARKVSPLRTCWLFDTFNGMTEPAAIDVSIHGIPGIKSYLAKQQKGTNWQAASVEEVRDNLRQLCLYDPDRLRFIVGPVEQTLLLNDLPDSIALLFLDTGWYSSTSMELKVLYPRLVKGGVLIVDDYGHWQGARKAVDEYLDGIGARRQLEPIDYTAIALKR